MASKTGKRAANILMLSLVLFVSIALIYPLLNIGYVEDDAINSLHPVRGLLLQENLFQEAWSQTLSILKGQGRFNPLLMLNMAFAFRLFPTLAIYKLSILLSCVACMLTFYGFLRMSNAEPALARLSLLLTALCFQFRSYHDPFIAYHGMPQIVFTLALCSLALLELFLKTKRPILLAGSLIAYMTGCLTYDSCLTLIGLHVVVLLFASKSKEKICASIAYSIMYAALALVAVVCKMQAHLPADSPYAVALNFGTVMRTYSYQLFAGLPLSYWFGHLHSPEVSQLLSLQFLQGAFNSCLISWPLLIIFVPLALIGCIPATEVKRQTLLKFGISALALIFLPSLPLAICRKYQEELTLGLGNMQVWMQYFGFGLLVAAICQFFLQIFYCNRRARILAYSLLCIASLPIFLITSYDNELVANSLRPWRDRRANLSSALESGILDRVPEGSQISFRSLEPFSGGAPWEATTFLYDGSKKLFRMKNENAMYNEQLAGDDGKILSRRLQPESGELKKYCLRNFWTNRESGVVVLTNDNRNPPADECIYVRGSRLGATSLQQTGILIPPAREMLPRKKGADWQLFDLKENK